MLQVDNLTTSYVYTQSDTVTDTIDYKRTFWTHHNFDFLSATRTSTTTPSTFRGSGGGFASPAQTYHFPQRSPVPTSMPPAVAMLGPYDPILPISTTISTANISRRS